MAIQTVGFLTKEEHVQSLESKIIPHTLVFESVEPFPGYHGSNLPTDKPPESFYIVLDKKYTSEDIFRVLENISGYLGIRFDASPAKITIYTQKYYCVRLRGFEDYSIISTLQQCLMDAEMMLHKATPTDASALTKIEKYFQLENLDTIGYKDLLDNKIHYLTLSKEITWSHFRSLTSKVKSNLGTFSFDAALATIFAGRVIDAVRIYSNLLSMDDLKAIHEKYNELL